VTSDFQFDTVFCDAHKRTIPKVSQREAEEHGLQYGCPDCRDELIDRPDPAEMTGDERADEVRSLLKGLGFAGFDAIWKRVDALVGRGTYTHELALPDALADEARTRSGVTDPEIVENRLRSLAGDKPVIVVRP
jgi:hypothetical protein